MVHCAIELETSQLRCTSCCDLQTEGAAIGLSSQLQNVEAHTRKNTAYEPGANESVSMILTLPHAAALDHVAVPELHGLGTLRAKLTSHDHLAKPKSGISSRRQAPYRYVAVKKCGSRVRLLLAGTRNISGVAVLERVRYIGYEECPAASDSTRLFISLQ